MIFARDPLGKSSNCRKLLDVEFPFFVNKNQLYGSDKNTKLKIIGNPIKTVACTNRLPQKLLANASLKISKQNVPRQCFQHVQNLKFLYEHLSNPIPIPVN